MSKKSKQKFYVVWKGRERGIFENWDDCKAQVHGFPDPVYKAFPTRVLAEEAFHSSSDEYIGKDKNPEYVLTDVQKLFIGDPILDSISVDGAWNTETGIVEYQGVHTGKGEKLFEVGPYEDGTNNIVEFLGIVHALAYCKKNGLDIPIYSDSKNAIAWVKAKQAKTNLVRSNKNVKLFEVLDRAVKWLHENEYSNQILKWETRAWGENPADFGRK